MRTTSSEKAMLYIVTHRTKVLAHYTTMASTTTSSGNGYAQGTIQYM